MNGGLVSSRGPRGVSLGSAGRLRGLWALAEARRRAEGGHKGPVSPFVSGRCVAGVTGGHLGTRKEHTHQYYVLFTGTSTGPQTAEWTRGLGRADVRSARVPC